MNIMLAMVAVLLTLFSLTQIATARVVTLIVGPAATNEVAIGSFEVAELSSYSFTHAGAFDVQLEKDGAVTHLYLQGLPTAPVKHVIAGPALLRVVSHWSEYGYCTFTITPESFPPDRTIIAMPGTNHTSITLECSTNLVQWSPATNGVYGPMPEAKFFRIKAQPVN